MNVVKFDNCAFVFPDDMAPFLKRYGVDVLYLDAEEGQITGIGPNDKDWRVIPSDAETGAVVRLRGVED